MNFTAQDIYFWTRLKIDFRTKSLFIRILKILDKWAGTLLQRYTGLEVACLKFLEIEIASQYEFLH